ncbi:TyeA family type III secretion system gatekeeper subunit [Chromobacterium violaceum]|uniref:TyeA family type III secretion system gatekeeper subunit n=1 Tax=Chromobacterium violaceum TaxID=536 RepID=UPI001BEAFBB4|nr:TyeA family type III secretion system gatekeeper subunit [Chromobacterium violaceum]MBT2869684.1 TyeA family type III secretion system gatekeeper subunit [Chromobacterium violaceum]
MLRLDQLVIGAAGGIEDGIAEPMPGQQDGGDSALALARAELMDFQFSALQETQEELGFALGGRLRDNRRAGPAQDNARGRVLAAKLVAELGTVEAATLDGVLDGPQDWMRSPRMLDALRQRHEDPGQMALCLAAWLARGKLDAKQRSRLEQALLELSADEGMALSLFGALNFGPVTPGLRQELAGLYRKASAPRQKLSQWLQSLGAGEKRSQQLKTMLQVLAFELSISGQPIVGSHLAAVIGDLKQLLRLLGLEAHCEQAAAGLALEGVDGETLLRALVTLLEQAWAAADSVGEALPPVPEQQYRLARTLSRLLQLLPDECFADDGHKEQLMSAAQEWMDRHAD